MKRVWILILVFSLVFSGLVFNSGTVLADSSNSSKKENRYKLPPGIAKKAVFNLDSKKILEKYENGLQKIFSVKKLTRAQTAYILAQINEDEYDNFDSATEILNSVADAKAIPKAYSKAVAFVISEKLMTYKTQPNGKILFQPNVNITWAEMYKILIAGGEPSSEVTGVSTYSGTVRFIYSIGDKTWIAIESSGELRTAYFASGTRPSTLDTGISITVKVNSDTKKIIESSLGTITSLNLLTLNQSNIETDTTGFSTYGVNTFAGSTLTKVTSDQWQGSASLKIATNGGSAWQGVNANYQGQSVTGPLTFSFYIKAPLDTPLRVIVYDQTNSSYPANNELNFTASGNWERKSITFTPAAASSDLHLQVTLNNNMSSIEYYLDGLQLEQGSGANTWVPGGTTVN